MPSMRTSKQPDAVDGAHHYSYEELMDLKQRGITTVFRYFAIGGGWKCLNEAELANFRRAGMNLTLIAEGQGDHAGYFNAAQGRADAQAVIARMRSMGLPPGAAVYFAVDYDANRGDINSRILPYFQAIRDEIRRSGMDIKVGVYGSGDVCRTVRDAGLAERTWLAGASGWGGTQAFFRSGQWDIVQHVEGNRDYDTINPLTHGVGSVTFTPDGRMDPRSQQNAMAEIMGQGARDVDPAVAARNLASWLTNPTSPDPEHDETRDAFYRDMQRRFGIDQAAIQRLLNEGGVFAMILMFFFMLLVGPDKMREIGMTGASDRPNAPPAPGTVFNPDAEGSTPGTPQSRGIQPDIARSLGVDSIGIQLDSTSLGILSALAAQGVQIDLAGPNGTGPDRQFDNNDIIAMGQRLTGSNVVADPGHHATDVIAAYQRQFGRPQQPQPPSTPGH